MIIELSQRKEKPSAIRNFLPQWWRCLLALLSGLLLALPFLESYLFGIAWVAFVPFLMAINGVSLFRSYVLGLVFGLGFCISAGYWVVDFLMLSKGYSFSLSVLWSLIFWFYCAHLNALAALCFSWLRNKSELHDFLLFPLVVTVFYAVFPMLFPVRLGDSQSLFIIAIQAIEFTGVYGLDAVIALTNIMLFRMINRVPSGQAWKAFFPWVVGVIVLLIWFGYGLFSTFYWDEHTKKSQTIRTGIVQANEAPNLEKSKPLFGYSRAYSPEMAMTERLSADGAELVIWSEAKYKGYLDQAHVAKSYQHQLNTMNTRLVFQDIHHADSNPLTTDTLQYNTAVMVSQRGNEIGQYQKMKRIPFGEYVPFVSGVPVLKGWVERFFGRFLNEMEAGEAHKVFDDQGLSVVPLICYEIMFPAFVADAVSHLDLRANSANILVSLSSNGWFGRTRQPYQHVNASVLRAVENRLPLVHAVNNGPSIVALPSGRVIFTSDYHQAGGYVVDVPYSHSAQRTYFSRHPNQFLYSVYGLLLAVFIYSFWKLRVVRFTPQ